MKSSTRPETRWHRIVFAGAVAIAACSSVPEGVESTQSPIVGGTDAPLCAWPAVVLVGGDCSGTLVHPQVVVTAAHCVNGGEVPVPRSIAFGEGALRSPARTVNVSRCAPSPKYNGGDTDDIGYCVLAQAITDMPLVPVMAACEAVALKAGSPIMEVGFGQSAVQTGANDGFGVKRFTSATINSLATNGRIQVTTGSQNGEYFGDSGGPIFFQMPDQTWRLIGADCCAPDIIPGSNAPRISTYTSVPLNVAWLESATGIDLTPCHDGSNWTPGALCSAFPTTPDKASGGWTTMCSATQAPIAPQATCNASADGGGASDASGTSGDGGLGDSGGSNGARGTGGSEGGPRGSGGAVGAGGSKGPDGSAGAGGRNGGADSDGGARDGGGAAGTSGFGGSGTGGTTGSGSIDAGTNQGSGGISAGEGGHAGSSGASATGGADTHNASDSSGGGCSCNLGARSTALQWRAALAALAMAAWRRRRRTRR